jgi:hypothetical protein
MSDLANAPFKIEKATLDDESEMLALMDKANAYALQQSGAPLWTTNYATKDLHKHLEKGNLYVIKNTEGAITSSIALSEETYEFWEEAASDSQALYFSKLMKDPEKSLHGEAKALLAFAATECLNRNKQKLRCDTVAELTGLTNYYLKIGFKAKGYFTYYSSNRQGILLESNAASVLTHLRQS